MLENRKLSDQTSLPFRGLQQLTPESLELKLFGEQIKGPSQFQQKTPADHVIIQLLSFKKKFCQKLAFLIQNLYSIDKDKSQNLTILIENRIRTFYPENIKDHLEDYKQGIKAIYSLIKVRIFVVV